MYTKETDIVLEAFGEGGLMSKLFPGYTPRPQQIELAKAIQAAIQEGVPLAGEAPTGVGKSMGSLIPAAEVIIKEDAVVVVVTSSIVLQEQYFHKDIPLLEKVLGRHLGAAMIKGRANYVCNHKAAEFSIKGMTNTIHQKEYVEIYEWSQETQTGDMSELSFVPRHQVWSDFAALEDSECQGKRCPAFKTCHYYRERARVLASKLVICNYHYFLTSMDHDKMLPEGIKVVIMDEAHEIASIARDFQEQRYTMNSLKWTFNQFLKMVRELGPTPSGDEATAFVMGAELNNLQGSIERVFVDLTDHYKRFKQPRHADNWLVQYDTRALMQPVVQEHYDALLFTINFTRGYIAEHGLDEEERPNWNQYYPEDQVAWQYAMENLWGGLMKRRFFLEDYFGFQGSMSAADLFFTSEDGEEKPPKHLGAQNPDIIYWMQENGDKGVSLHVKPSMAHPLMGPILDTRERSYTPIMMSATLAINGRLEHLKEQLGIPTQIKEAIVSSPFNLEENLLWYLPGDVPPGNLPEHAPRALTEMLKVIQELHGRTLCLFTSNKALQEATTHFRRILPSSIDVVAQGEYPRQKIIEMMRANPHTVILGTRSFFTGVDIQGQNLSAVLLDKLPYPMIGDPVNDYLMSRDGGFWKFTLVELIISLKQAFGRLNRTTSDRGIVACYDGRLSTSSYKAIIFNSFAFKVTGTRDWNKVREFLQMIPM